MAKEQTVGSAAKFKSAAGQLPAPDGLAPALVKSSFLVRAKSWIRDEGPWWLCSFVFHLVLVCSLALVGSTAMEAALDDAPQLEQANVDKTDAEKEAQQQLDRFEVGDTPDDPTELNTETLTLPPPGQVAQEERYYDDNPVFTEKGGGMASATDQSNLGGLGGFDIKGIGPGPAVKGKGGVGVGVGTGTHPGSGGDGYGFGGRGTGSRKAMLGSGGGTRQSERAVAAALNWLARHQSADGSWSLDTYTTRCKDATCAGPGASRLELAGTAMGLLPFFAAGQTHQSKGPYQQVINSGVYYLLGKQLKPEGGFPGHYMYSHGLISIALCECFGMTGDPEVGKAAQMALNHIADAQDPEGGGWRYSPRVPGDLSVTGWQIMALKSGQMAYLNVNPVVFDKAKKFLLSVSSSGKGAEAYGGLFGYTAEQHGPSTRLTAVGLLCSQYMGMQRNDPAMVAGTAYMMKTLPDPNNFDIYYWYYATQALHNQPGPDWDAWNRKVRRILIDTQCKEGCAAGSWDGANDAVKSVRQSGGRVMETSLCALTLEVYYRYLPLYKLDKEAAAPPGVAAGKAEAK